MPFLSTNRRLIDMLAGVEQSIIVDVIDHRRRRLYACLRAAGGTHCDTD